MHLHSCSDAPLVLLLSMGENMPSVSPLFSPVSPSLLVEGVRRYNTFIGVLDVVECNSENCTWRWDH